MEVGSWEVIKGLMSWVVYPLMLLLGYLFKKQAMEMSVLRVEVDELKIKQAVVNSQIQDIKEGIRDLTDVVREAGKIITQDIKNLRKEILDASIKYK